MSGAGTALWNGNYSFSESGHRWISQTCSSCSMYMEGKWRLAVDGVSLAYEAKVSLMLDVRSSRELKLTTPETRSQAVSSEPPLTRLDRRRLHRQPAA